MGVSFRGWTAGLMTGVLVLGACAEDQTYLPGEREDIRSVLQNPDLALPLDGPTPQNQSRAIALGAATNNASWTHSIGTAQYRIAHPALGSVPQLAWSADIGAGDSRRQRITADPVVAAGRVFTLDADARVTATSTSGATLWTRDLTPASDRQGQSSGGGLAVEGDTLYVSVGYGVLAALDVASGGVRWEQKLEATGTGTPTVFGDLIYLTSGDDTGWAVRKSDGRVEWQTAATASINNVLGAPAPAITSQFAIFAFGSGEVQGVFRRGGVNRWNSAVVGRRPGRASSLISDVTSAPVVSGDRVYVGNQSGRLAALSIDSGVRLWTARDGAMGPVWPAGGSIFAMTDLNELVRLDASDGSRIWGARLPNFVKDKPKRQSEVFAHYGPVIAGGRVIIASNDGLLRSYSPVDGTLISSVEIPGGATTAPVVAGGTLYVVSAKGQLHAYR
ncbi:PQQ-binding-like beta-propeller repeat protein [Sulfitobacter sp. TSTF-M16]|uniref:PQQ-binding-like beta-propeller repeat protein n=2 Tax=Sulfitobacter aestuariivivens TaxID=2766981 RepID=A0A927D158_9RHOB|nr:PQQ-binding-like beta-propeller repeat protein [Sulfitobacter aestuariivivens]